jgi:hypothetical protein
MRLIVVCLVLVFAGCATDEGPLVSAENLTPLVREYAFQDQPKLNPKARFKIEEYKVDGLWKNLKTRLFLVRYLSSNGEQFNERLLIYRDQKLTPFACVVGGNGLMSAIMVDNNLYYTYSWGSGIHRSHIGRLSIEGTDIRIVESSGYENIDLFIRKVGDRIQVEEGRFTSFNSWESGRDFGWIMTKGSSLAVINGEGEEIAPRFDVIRK